MWPITDVSHMSYHRKIAIEMIKCVMRDIVTCSPTFMVQLLFILTVTVLRKGVSKSQDNIG